MTPQNSAKSTSPGSNTFTRRTFLGGTLAAAAASSVPANITRANARPNVVLVMTDDQGYGDIQRIGNPDLPTPALNTLYDDSVRLTNFHVSPTCSPTRAALMTGRYHSRTGVWHTIMGRSLLRRDEITMADAFRDAGYRTGIFGKWHLGDSYPFRPQDRGFDECFIHGGGGVGQMPDFWGNDYFDDTYFRNGIAENVSGYCTDVWFDEAAEFIEQNHDKPFFCYVPTNAPHSPYFAPESDIEKFRQAGIESPRAEFYGMLNNIDTNVGRLREKLDDLNLSDNTIFIFMTDNGTSAGHSNAGGFNAGMRGKKGSQYEGGHRVPCLIHWPAGMLASGQDIPQLTAHIDLFPTLLELCGINGAPHGEFDGQNISPYLRDSSHPDSGRIIITESQRIETPQKWRKCCTMQGNLRLIDGKELYDIENDPGQQRDISAERPEVHRGLRQAYERWWQSVSERHDEFCPLIIGHEAEPEVRINSHDWHGEKVPWNQPHIRDGMPGNGFWAIDIARDGDYSFELRRWPREAAASLDGAHGDGKALPLNQARIRCADEEATATITPGADSVDLRLSLRAGEQRLQTWFEGTEEDRGAYYVYAKRIGG